MINIIKITITLLFFYNNAYAFPKDVQDNLDNLIASEKNEYYQDKLKIGDYDYFQKISLGKKEFNFIAIQGGTHSGVLYILSADNNKTSYSINMGPIYNIITNQSIDYLKENEFVVISATGGTGTQEIFGALFRLENNSLNILLTFPIAGDFYPMLAPDSEGSLVLSYKMGDIKIGKNLKYILNYQSKFTNVPKVEQAKILKELELKSEHEVAEIIINPERSLEIKSQSAGVMKSLEWYLKKSDFIEINNHSR